MLTHLGLNKLIIRKLIQKYWINVIRKTFLYRIVTTLNSIKLDNITNRNFILYHNLIPYQSQIWKIEFLKITLNQISTTMKKAFVNL